MHGYMSETEPWKYGQKVEDNMRKMLNLRYQLLPYIYSEAWQVTSKGSTMMRPLVMDFANDAEAVKQAYQFMFGKAFLVAPITEAGTTQRNVYLPKAAEWYNFWSDKRFAGGQSVLVDAPIDQIPVFVKAGSIVPVGPVVQYSDQNSNETLELRIYEGANGEFTLYEDEGDNYNYENGKYSEITFVWNDDAKTLTINDRAGDFEGMLESRQFDVKIIGQNSIEKTVDYTGNKETLQF
jgi:alpha-D-xyloside xylohydrolase